LGITVRTIEHLKQRFVEEGLDGALERKETDKPRAVRFGGEFEARLTPTASLRCIKHFRPERR
jgi:hypothetical protein